MVVVVVGGKTHCFPERDEGVFSAALHYHLQLQHPVRCIQFAGEMNLLRPLEYWLSGHLVVDLEFSTHLLRNMVCGTQPSHLISGALETEKTRCVGDHAVACVVQYGSRRLVSTYLHKTQSTAAPGT